MSQNPLERLRVHNAGKVKSTKSHVPFEIVYVEQAASRSAARAREKYLKSAAGRG